jgi:hypothetical protein
MLLSVLCPNVKPESEPEHKQWLQQWYLTLGHDHVGPLTLGFKPPANPGEHNEEDELNDMYQCLRLVQCKAILMEKLL